MVRGKGKQVLSYAERMNLADQKKELEATLKETQVSGKGTSAEAINTGAIRREIQKIEHAIEDGSPTRITGSTKDKLVAEARALEEKISAGMPSRDEMRHPAKYPGAIQKHMNWNQRNQADIIRYQQIQRQVNPEAPNSIEQLRKDK
jgi:hypothetical protein